jgi:hypothetical protein
MEQLAQQMLYSFNHILSTRLPYHYPQTLSFSFLGGVFEHHGAVRATNAQNCQQHPRQVTTNPQAECLCYLIPFRTFVVIMMVMTMM